MKDTHATIHYGGNDFFVAIAPSGHALTLDTNGQRSAAPSPLELLLVALGACTGADVVAVLHKKREQLTDYRIEVHGDRREDFPKSFRRMEVRHILTGRKLNEASVAKAIELSTDKYCSVAATLRPTAEIVTSYEIHEAESQLP
ncbi:MAG TPA: OsmC family protein [Bryobacteraceae bacterium]|nr:OsmC family protein [Bryobacteraceae bacterium]